MAAQTYDAPRSRNPQDPRALTADPPARGTPLRPLWPIRGTPLYSYIIRVAPSDLEPHRSRTYQIEDSSGSVTPTYVVIRHAWDYHLTCIIGLRLPQIDLDSGTSQV